MEQLNTAGAVSPQQSVKGLSLRGLGEIIYKPAAFFEQLKDNPRVLVPILAIFIGVFIFTFAIADIQQQDQIELLRNSRFAQDQAIDSDTSVTKKLIGAAVAGIMVAFLPTLLAAALAMLLGNFLMAGSARFKQIWSVGLYGSIITILGMLIKMPLIFAKGTTFVSLSFAALIPGLEPTSATYILLEAFNFFSIWEIIVVGIGFATIYGFTRNKGYVISVVSIGAILLLFAGFQIFAMSLIT
ncbi:MAG: YIP1 family protein [Candidatus Zixiibacteriota bacterium]|nr:MAG: YIP1 family protein [candidate division Zixibacteria bacterium]